MQNLEDNHFPMKSLTGFLSNFCILLSSFTSKGSSSPQFPPTLLTFTFR